MIPVNYSSLVLSTPGFDDLLITGQTVDSDGNSFGIYMLDENGDWSSPQAVDTAVQRWMIDGAVAATQSSDNRTIAFEVEVTADTSVALAMGEAALAQRADRPGVLAWTPPEGSVAAPVTCFELWTWHFAHSLDSIDERHIRRIYTLTLTAKPWARSADRISVAAVVPPGSITVTSVDDCTTTTAWTADSSFGTLTPTVVSGAVVASHIAPNGNRAATFVVDLTRTGTVSMTSTPYIRIDAKATPPSGFMLVSADGVFLTQVASAGTVSWWQMPTGVTSFTHLTIGANYNVDPRKTPTLKLTVNDVSKTDGINPLGTSKQLVRSLDVGGSVKTTGSIQISSPSSTGLGTVVAYTCPDDGSGYVPAMRQNRTSGSFTPTVDLTNTVSGSWERISNGVLTYTLAPNLLREANYTIVARVRCAATGRSPFNLSTYVGTRTSAPALFPFFATFATASTWEWHTIGSVTLPSSPVPVESTSTVTILLNTYNFGTLTDGAPGQVDLDELYLFDMTNGDLSIITPIVTGTTQAFLDSADYDLSRNRAAIYYGTQADRSDAIGVKADRELLTFDEHHLDPNGSILFTVTDGVSGSLASATFYRRWHTHAGS